MADAAATPQATEPAEREHPSETHGWDAQPAPLADDLLRMYLDFIGVERPAQPDLVALCAIQLAHPRAIPFENLDALLGRPIALDHAALATKLLSGERGGYCFEHNMLLAAALSALGYRVRLLAGRMLFGLPGPFPRTHLALLVTTPNGERLVDVGFGRHTMTAPIPTEPGHEVEVRGDRYRMTELGGEWVVEGRRGDGDWLEMYVLDPRPVYPVDVEAANHFVATHPHSHLRSRVIVLRPTDAGKRSIGGRRLVIDEGRRQIERELEPDELGAVLSREFGITLPARLDRLET